MRTRPTKTEITLHAVLVAAFLTTAWGESASARPPDPEPELTPCRPEGLDEEVLCGTVEVPENPDLPEGRRISLNVMVLPATGPDPAPEPVVPFAGGPGEGMVDGAPAIAQAHREIREVRDLLLVDVRGTGKSNPLRCSYQDEHTYLERFMPFDGVARCVDELSGKADLRQYTSSRIVDDVDRVREALGYDKVILTGGSYGTRAVQVYMKRHPEHVAAAHLHGVVPIDDEMPRDFARDAQRALDGVIDECMANDACREVFPRLPAELWEVIGRLEDGHTIPATVADPETGEEKRIDVGRASFLHGLRYMLYRVQGASQVPLAIHRAAAGDASIVASVADVYDRGLADAVSEGLYLSVTCTEDVPWIELEDAVESAAGTFLGELRYRIQTAACSVWPRGELPEDFFEPVRSGVPVLITSGALDPVTPPEHGARVARYLPGSLHLVVPSGAHGLGGLEGIDCVKAVEREFLSTGSLEGLETDCMAGVRRAGFALEGEAEVIELPAEALARLAGRYVSEVGMAVTVTLWDDGVLRAEAPGRGTFRLAPTSETRFRIVGAPPGLVLEFRIEDGEALSVTLEQGPGQTMELIRSTEEHGETGGDSGE